MLLAWAVLVPLGWAVAGAPALPDPGWPTDSLDGVWSYAGARVPVASAWLIGAGLLGAVAAVGRSRAATHVSTVAHEFGHSLVAALFGARVTGIRLHLDGSGTAHYRMSGSRPLMRGLVALAGYLAPGILAIACARAAAAGAGPVWLAFLSLVVAVMLPLAIRSWWGVALALGLVGAGVAVLGFAPPAAATVVVAALAGVLAGGGVLDARSQWRSRRARNGSDAASLAEQSGLPVGLFAGLHVTAAAGLAAGAGAFLAGW
jgi:Peptidase M50B-like